VVPSGTSRICSLSGACMAWKPGKSDLYTATGSSRPQRAVILITAALATAVAWWILAGAGLAAIEHCFGWAVARANLPRRFLLTAALSIYFVRLCFTQLVFLKRNLSWREAGMVAPWILILYLFFSLAGGTNEAAMDHTFTAVGLFVLGSWMNTHAEYERNTWKRRPENRGKLYTSGLFRYSRHPNYLGDLLSFSGIALLTGRWAAATIPLLMLAGFVFVNIPMLDAHLRDHYADAFDAYAARTARLIPFLY
jgi:protein-S-isoprenylcysteine O-methyltransferase Ste14